MVRLERHNAAAICRFVRPSNTCRSTSRSTRVSGMEPRLSSSAGRLQREATTVDSRSACTGISRQLDAPAFIAWTAPATCPPATRTTAGTPCCARRARARNRRALSQLVVASITSKRKSPVLSRSRHRCSSEASNGERPCPTRSGGSRPSALATPGVKMRQRPMPASLCKWRPLFFIVPDDAPS